MKVLVLGAGGQLGLSISNLKENKNHSFIFTAKKELDITEYEKIYQYILAEKPDITINACAYTAVDRAEVEKEIANDINNIAVTKLARSCKDAGSFLIHVSTDYVFEGNTKRPYKEDDIPNPKSVYGKTKLLGEQGIKASGCNYIIFRTSWIFSEYGSNFLLTILDLAKNRDILEIVDDQIGCPTYAGDLARVIFSSIDKIEKNDLKSGTYHFSGSHQCSWYDFARLIFHHNFDYGTRSPIINPINTKIDAMKANRPKFSVLDSSKTMNLFNIKPTEINLAINQTIKRVNQLKKV
ncbi:MAG: dTDP-4-dehydrorhamnose reductase [Gammaproteobacteria bacterium]